MKGNRFLIIFIVLLLIVMDGCGYLARYDGPYKGKVVDADTGKPIEGVVVLGVWYKETPTPAGAVSSYYDARETVTDKNGEFEIPGMGLKVLSTVAPMNVLIFKAGYKYESGLWESLKDSDYYKRKVKWEGKKAIIPLKKLTMEERVKQIGPPSLPSEAPFEKVRLMLLEIDKNDAERGLPTRKIWKGKKIE
jgi:hypothetical protein